MSDLLTHWAVFDDTCRLAIHDPHIEPFLNQVLEQQKEMARLGAITRYGSRWMPPLLKSLCERKSETEMDQRLQRKLAFALGVMLHFPADQIFKPLMSELAQADWNSTHTLMQGRAADQNTTQNPVSIREISAYYDCHVFRKVYLEGQSEPFSRFLLAENDAEPGQALEAFVQALFQRALLSSHTLDPDIGDFDSWLDNLLDRVQPLYIDIKLYTEVFTKPDPAKMLSYRIETDFYNDHDPLIQLARHAQRGETIAADELEHSQQPGANRSGYVECLRMGMRLVREASAFWRGEASDPPDVQQRTGWRPASTKEQNSSNL